MERQDDPRQRLEREEEEDDARGRVSPPGAARHRRIEDAADGPADPRPRVEEIDRPKNQPHALLRGAGDYHAPPPLAPRGAVVLVRLSLARSQERRHDPDAPARRTRRRARARRAHGEPRARRGGRGARDFGCPRCSRTYGADDVCSACESPFTATSKCPYDRVTVGAVGPRLPPPVSLGARPRRAEGRRREEPVRRPLRVRRLRQPARAPRARRRAQGGAAVGPIAASFPLELPEHREEAARTALGLLAKAERAFREGEKNEKGRLREARRARPGEARRWRPRQGEGAGLRDRARAELREPLGGYWVVARPSKPQPGDRWFYLNQGEAIYEALGPLEVDRRPASSPTASSRATTTASRATATRSPTSSSGATCARTRHLRARLAPLPRDGAPRGRREEPEAGLRDARGARQGLHRHRQGPRLGEGARLRLLVQPSSKKPGEAWFATATPRSPLPRAVVSSSTPRGRSTTRSSRSPWTRRTCGRARGRVPSLEGRRAPEGQGRSPGAPRARSRPRRDRHDRRSAAVRGGQEPVATLVGLGGALDLPRLEKLAQDYAHAAAKAQFGLYLGHLP